MPKNGQYKYPEEGWSTGRMRMAKAGPRGLDQGREFRELEGERKRRETKVSGLATGGEQTGPTQYDDMHYDELQRRIGMENMEYIRDMDALIMDVHQRSDPNNPDTGFRQPKAWKNWERFRQQLIDSYERPDSGVVTHKDKVLTQGPGPQKWETG